MLELLDFPCFLLVPFVKLGYYYCDIRTEKEMPDVLRFYGSNPTT